jgi:CheY-like chemotaxis protein
MATVLIVDDSGFIRRSIARIIKGGGYEILEAADGKEAIDKIISHSPDCMTLDLLMPVMNGAQTLAELKERGLTVPVIILSADVQESVREECFKFGVIDFLGKPPDKEKLLSTIEKAIASKEGKTHDTHK